MTPPSSNRTWFWRTLMLSCSSSPWPTTRRQLLERAGRHVDLEAGRQRGLERRLLDAQAVGVGGDHPQLRSEAETRMPVSTGRVSSREAEPATFWRGRDERRRRGARRRSASGSGNGGKSSPRSVRMWKRGVAGDELDVLLGGAELERHLRGRQRADDVEQQASREHDGALAATSASSGTRRPTSMSVARSSQPSCVAASWTPESAWIALRVEATRLTVCSCREQSVALERDLHDEYLRREVEVIGVKRSCGELRELPQIARKLAC